MQQMECCYLKIFKNFSGLSKPQRRLFEVCTEKFFLHLMRSENRREQSVSTVRHFLRLFCEGLESSVFMVRVCCGRHLFMLLRALSAQQLNEVLDDRLALDVLNNTIGLFRMSNKTEKGLGVKLGAYLQHIQFDERNPKLKQSCITLRSEMVKTVCEEERRDLRCDALTNLEVSKQTLQYVIVRVRDVDVGVRLQVLKKLIKSKVRFKDFDLCDLYQLIHDGYRNSSQEVRKQTQQLVMLQFYEVRSSGEQVEEEKSNQKRQQQVQGIRRTIQEFLGWFQMGGSLLLLHPHLYDLMVEVVRTILQQYREPQELSLYFKELFVQRMGTLAEVMAEELFFGRVALCQQDLDQSILQAIDKHFLDGCQLSDYILSRWQQGAGLLELFELLQMAQCLINCDETGRVRLVETLRRMVV